MNLRQIAEVAAVAAADGGVLINADAPLPEGLLRDYWHHSRQRLNGWIKGLSGYRDRAEASSPEQSAAHWRTDAAPLLAEVFVCEMLTRVWTAVLTAADRRRNIAAAAPVARNVLAGHHQARNLALKLMLHGPHPPKEQLAAIDRLRRRSERWTDLLVGPLLVRYRLDDLEDLAFDTARAVEFGRDQLSQGCAETDGPVRELVLAGLGKAFPAGPPFALPHADHHRAIACAVLAAFPAERPEVKRMLQSLRRARLERSGFLPEGPPGTLPLLNSLAKEGTEEGTGRPAKGISFKSLRKPAP